MTGGFFDGNILRGLAFRILVFLSLALLPFGLIAVVQTREIVEQSARNAELSMIGLTERAAVSERAVIQEAFGAAAALTSIVRAFISDPVACSNFLGRYVAVEERYSQIGFVGRDGLMTCTSAGSVYDFTEDPVFKDLLLNPRQTVTLNSKGVIIGEPVLVIFQPVYREDSFLGFMTMSVPRRMIRDMRSQTEDRRPYDLLIFNEQGAVLLSDLTASDAESNLPKNRSLTALVGENPAVFSDVNALDADRLYSVVPIVSGAVYSMAVWRSDDILGGTEQAGMLSILLPVLMWVASLIVAFWSINRLALRHIRKVSRQMRYFAFNRQMPQKTLGQGVPRELQEIQQSFVNMAGSIIRDEAALEDNIRDKNILLKEVHHRVKNNLQLISSIMNMQIRRAKSEDARFVLKRLQERILSLATVHKSLYQSERLDRVDAGALIREIVGQLLVVGLPAGSGVHVTQNYETVLMDADDAAPLTLTVSEAVTNALKYIGKPASGEEATLNIRLEMVSDKEVLFLIENSTGDASVKEGTGLGSQLISAFARQLNAQMDIASEDAVHRLVLKFPVSHHTKEIRDF